MLTSYLNHITSRGYTMLHHVTCVDYAAVVCEWLACLSPFVLGS